MSRTVQEEVKQLKQESDALQQRLAEVENSLKQLLELQGFPANTSQDDYDTIIQQSISKQSHLTPKHQLLNNEKRYWSDTEHIVYLKAVYEKGKTDMQQVRDYIKTRSIEQVRSHAQKYTIKLDKMLQDIVQNQFHAVYKQFTQQLNSSILKQLVQTNAAPISIYQQIITNNISVSNILFNEMQNTIDLNQCVDSGLLTVFLSQFQKYFPLEFIDLKQKINFQQIDDLFKIEPSVIQHKNNQQKSKLSFYHNYHNWCIYDNQNQANGQMVAIVYSKTGVLSGMSTEGVRSINVAQFQHFAESLLVFQINQLHSQDNPNQLVNFIKLLLVYNQFSKLQKDPHFFQIYNTLQAVQLYNDETFHNILCLLFCAHICYICRR